MAMLIYRGDWIRRNSPTDIFRRHGRYGFRVAASSCDEVRARRQG
ncbi:hypothetical protein [Devosia sp. A369]